MKVDRRIPWLAWMTMLVVAVACLGLAGCDDDDDDDRGGGTTVVVVTNETTGVVTTNVIVVEDVTPQALPDPADDEADAEEEPALLNVQGRWTGNFTGQAGRGQIALDVYQSGNSLDVQGRVNRGGADEAVTSRGSILRDHMGMTLVWEVPSTHMVLDGHVNASANRWEGNFTATFDEGTFTMRR